MNLLVVDLRKKLSMQNERSVKLTTLKVSGKTVRNDVHTFV